MNTQEVIVLMRRMEAAWPNIFAKSKDRETLYSNELASLDYMAASSTLNRLIGDLKNYPSIAELRQAMQSHTIEALETEFVDYGPGRTSENKPVATHLEAAAAFARGYRKAVPDATDQQINAIFGNMIYGEQDQEIF